ncbi:hypothetical protein DXG01_012948 [Tephrocybe rancida]|nr:hypothetical protein DXG01_012948 [Tephrocybe rancida]
MIPAWTSVVRRFHPPLRQDLQALRSDGTITATKSTQTPINRALLIGINYENLPPIYRLQGPQQEAVELGNLLIEKYDYTREFMVVLTDNVEATSDQFSSKENIMKALRTFYDDQVEGDQFFFYFGGHAFQDDTKDEKEEDKKDEFLLPSINPDTQINTFKKLWDASKDGKTMKEIVRGHDVFVEEDSIVDDLSDYLATDQFGMPNANASLLRVPVIPGTYYVL